MCTVQCKMYYRPVVQKVGSYMHHSVFVWRVGSYWCISMDCTWTAGFLVGSPVPVQNLLWIGRIMLLVVMTNVFCCCVLFLMGSHVFFISYVFSCLSKWFQCCPFCENCFLSSALSIVQIDSDSWLNGFKKCSLGYHMDGHEMSGAITFDLAAMDSIAWL